MPGPPPIAADVEPVTELDLAEFARLEEACFPEPWSLDSLTRLFRQEDFLFMKRTVPESPGRLASSALFRANTAAGEAELLRICSDPALRRQGHARDLLKMSRAVLEGQQIEDLYLEVRRNNLPALKLYHQLDFEPLGVRARYYPDGTDALTLVWRLEPPSPTRDGPER